MSHRFAIAALAVVWATLSVTSTGCLGLKAGVDMGILGIPIPVSPYFQKKKEDEFWNHERYEKVPILGPLVPGAPTEALDPPSDDEVMRAWERANPIQGGLPFLHEYQRNNVRIIKDKIADYVDPPRVVPLLGPVQLHHCHYKCTIYYSETTRVGWPVPHTLVDEDSQEVIYIDHNHFHMVGNINPGPSANF
ncbi:MAG TPA: hypothetical protein VFB96_16145 [Pirellulaceae bacterium]|nr:hypothetical protein [Pirellulaceae bacterium]